MIAEIDAARDAGDTMGGSFEVIVRGVPPGLGSHVQWDRKLDGRLAQALMSIPAIKAVGIGRGPAVASLPGSRIHDEILPATGVPRASGIPPVASHQQRRRARGWHHQRRRPADHRLHEADRDVDETVAFGRSGHMTVSPATVERSDVCAVPAAAVVAEAMVAFVLADAAVEKFGGDSLEEMLDNWRAFRARTTARFSLQP